MARAGSGHRGSGAGAEGAGSWGGGGIGGLIIYFIIDLMSAWPLYL